LVPSLHSEVLNPNIDFENSPFKVQQSLEEWSTQDNKARIAGISSFGAGGSNAHIIIQEYVSPQRADHNVSGPAIIVLSAKNANRLREKVLNLKDFVENNKEINLYDLAYTLQTGREAMEERLAFLTENKADLISQLNNYLNHHFEELLTGNVRKDDSGFLLEGKAGKAYLESALEEKESLSLIKLWIKEVSIDWDLLYQENKPSIIGLPFYPFAKESYWFAKKEEDPVQQTIHVQPLIQVRDEQKLHPLLHAYKKEPTF
jgi:acyl transferase domain-containing protein